MADPSYSAEQRWVCYLCGSKACGFIGHLPVCLTHVWEYLLRSCCHES